MIEPKNDREAAILAEEDFILDVQYRIWDVMNAQDVTQRSLARRLNVSEARVSQFLSERPNITIRQLARIFHALNACCELRVRDGVTRSWEHVTAKPVATNVAPVIPMPLRPSKWDTAASSVLGATELESSVA